MPEQKHEERQKTAVAALDRPEHRKVREAEGSRREAGNPKDNAARDAHPL